MLSTVDDPRVARGAARRDVREADARVADAMDRIIKRLDEIVHARFRKGRKLAASDIDAIGTDFDIFAASAGVVGLRKGGRTPTRARPDAASIERVGVVFGGFVEEKMFVPAFIRLSASRRRAELDFLAMPAAWTVHASERFYTRAGNETRSTETIGLSVLRNFVMSCAVARTSREMGLGGIAVPADHGLILGKVYPVDQFEPSFRIRITYDASGRYTEQSQTVCGIPLADQDPLCSSWIGRTYVGVRELKDSQATYIDRWNEIALAHGDLISRIATSIGALPSDERTWDYATLAEWIGAREALLADVRILLNDPDVRRSLSSA